MDKQNEASKLDNVPSREQIEKAISYLRTEASLSEIDASVIVNALLDRVSEQPIRWALKALMS